MSRSIVRGPHRSRRTRPSAVSITRSASSSSAGASSVSAASIWLRYAGWATGPIGAVSSMLDWAINAVDGSAAIAARARARYAARSPRLDPSAMYATSRIGRALRHDLGEVERAAQCNVRFAHRDTRRAHARAVGERALDDGVGNLFEIVDRAAAHHLRNERVESAVVHHAVAGSLHHAHRQIDLDRLRGRALVRQDANERVKAHAAQGDLVSAVHRRRRAAAQAASIAARSDAASLPARSTLSPAARTIALPTTTPSAMRATAAACSGVDTPN